MPEPPPSRRLLRPRSRPPRPRLRPPRPRFSLLLSGLVAVAALAILLAGGGGQGSGQPGGQRAPAVSGHRVRACVTTAAQARHTARTVVTATARATVPERVSQTVIGPLAAVTVTRGGSFTARVKASRHIAITQRAVARARRCATGPSLTAARGSAVRRAYAVARLRAQKDAAGGAARGLRALRRRVYPLVRVEARSAALRRAQAQALAARPSLLRAARRQARRRAGA